MPWRNSSAPETEAEWSIDGLNWSDDGVDDSEDEADESPENGEHCEENDADPEPEGHETAFWGHSDSSVRTKQNNK